MANLTYVVNEIVGTSNEDADNAIRNGVKRASQTLRNLDWFEVVEVRDAIMDGGVAHYQVTMNVGFRLDDQAKSWHRHSSLDRTAGASGWGSGASSSARTSGSVVGAPVAS